MLVNDRMLGAFRSAFCSIQGAFECRIMVHLGLSADGSLVSSHVAHDLLKCSEKLNVAASTGWPGGMAPGQHQVYTYSCTRHLRIPTGFYVLHAFVGCAFGTLRRQRPSGTHGKTRVSCSCPAAASMASPQGPRVPFAATASPGTGRRLGV